MNIVLNTVMCKSTFLLVASIVGWLQPCLTDGQRFTSCSYINCIGYTNLGVITLNNTPSISLYQATDDLTMDVYLWKPCEDFTIGGITAGAIQQTQTSFPQDLGVHRQASCQADGGYVRFTMLSGDTIRFSYVKCLCGSGNVFQFESENPTLTYNFNFTSEYCCPSSGGGSSSSSISVGSLIVIIFFALVVAYIIFGTIFQVAVRKAQGRERIPNVSLWWAVPGLIRDGFIFVFTCGRRSTYGKI